MTSGAKKPKITFLLMRPRFEHRYWIIRNYKQDKAEEQDKSYRNIKRDSEPLSKVQKYSDMNYRNKK